MMARRKRTQLSMQSQPTPHRIITDRGGKSMFIIVITTRYASPRIMAARCWSHARSSAVTELGWNLGLLYWSFERSNAARTVNSKNRSKDNEKVKCLLTSPLQYGHEASHHQLAIYCKALMKLDFKLEG